MMEFLRHPLLWIGEALRFHSKEIIVTAGVTWTILTIALILVTVLQ